MDCYDQVLQAFRDAKNDAKDASSSRSSGVHLLGRLIESLAEAGEYMLIQSQQEIVSLKQRIEQLERLVARAGDQVDAHRDLGEHRTRFGPSR